MSAFRQKSIGATDTLGERLKRVREELGLSVEEAAVRSGISAKYVQAIEEGSYNELPGTVYTKNFIRKYAHVLEVSEETAVGLFEREHSVAAKLSPTPSTVPGKPVRMRAWLTPEGIKWAFILVLGIAVLVYLGLEIRNFTAPPSLVVVSPPDQTTTTSRSVELAGTTTPEATVTVNGKAVLVDRQGAFSEQLDLQDGLNTVIVKAQKKHGKPSTVIRQILVTSPTN